MWAVITIFVVTCTDESMDEEYHISYDRNRDMELAFAYMLFSLFWICQFLLATEEYIISAVITRWYEGNVPASTFALAFHNAMPCFQLTWNGHTGAPKMSPKGCRLPHERSSLC